MYINAEEVHKFQCHHQENVGHVVEITFRGIVLIKYRKGEIVVEMAMTNSRSHSDERGQNQRGRSLENRGERNNLFASDGCDQNTSNQQGNGR